MDFVCRPPARPVSRRTQLRLGSLGGEVCPPRVCGGLCLCGLPAHSPAGPRSPSIHLAPQSLSLAKTPMPLGEADNLGGLLSTGSSNQMWLGCRVQAAGQEGPEMLQISPSSGSQEREAAQRGHFIVRASPAPCSGGMRWGAVLGGVGESGPREHPVCE